MSNKATVGVEALSHIMAPPERACKYVGAKISSIGDNPTQAAKKLEVSPSTVKRFLDGGSLTTSMASRLYSVYGMDPETLFNLEAKANAYEAKHINMAATA